jgi:plastocyanin
MKQNTCDWLVFLLAVILLGCSGPDNRKKAKDEKPYPEHGEQQKALTSTENAEVTIKVVNRTHYHTVEIKQMKFVPAELMVEEGDTVVWVNNGITMHDVTEQQSHEWSSKELPVGASWTMIAAKSAEYYCSIHVVMKGKLLIKQ